MIGRTDPFAIGSAAAAVKEALATGWTFPGVKAEKRIDGLAHESDARDATEGYTTELTFQVSLMMVRR